MKYFATLAFGALLAASGSAAAQSDFKVFMKAMIPKVEKAFATKDVAFFDSIAAPDFVEKSMGQTFKRKDAMNEMKASIKTTKSMTIHLKLVSAQASAGTGHAVLTGSATMTMAPGKDGKSHVMAMQFTERETWVRTGSTWKLQVLAEDMGSGTMDGKPMPSGASGH